MNLSLHACSQHPFLGVSVAKRVIACRHSPSLHGVYSPWQESRQRIPPFADLRPPLSWRRCLTIIANSCQSVKASCDVDNHRVDHRFQRQCCLRLPAAPPPSPPTPWAHAGTVTQWHSKPPGRGGRTRLRHPRANPNAVLMREPGQILDKTMTPWYNGPSYAGCALRGREGP